MTVYKEVGRPTHDSIEREQPLPKVTNVFMVHISQSCHREGEGEEWEEGEGGERGGGRPPVWVCACAVVMIVVTVGGVIVVRVVFLIVVGIERPS